MRRSLIRGIAAGTLFFFSVQTVQAAPAIELGAFRELSESPASRIDFNIPSAFGEVKAVYEADTPESPVVVHIEDAHGNLDAQKNIESLIRYLSKEKNFNLIFLEGGAERLRPELARFLKDPAANRAVTETLMEKALLSGAEAALLDPESKIAAWGLEDPETYKNDLSLFRKVYQLESQSARYLDEVDRAARLLESRFLGKELREFVKEWRMYRSSESQVLRYVHTLEQFAKSVLSLDLADPKNQSDYPALLRILKLEEAERGIDMKKAAEEKEAVIQKLEKELNIAEFSAALREIEKESQPRYLMERVEDKVRGKIDFNAFPHFTRYAKIVIFQAEIRSSFLFEEADSLGRRILEELSTTPQEDRLIGFLEKLEMLRKLCRLEISRSELRRINEEKAAFSPLSISDSLHELAAEAGVEAGVFPSKDMLQAFDSAIEFYRLAVEREEHFFNHVFSKMKSAGQNRAIVVTGGFHSEGVQQALRGKKISYVEVAPRIRDAAQGRQPYLEAMLGRDFFEKSQIANILAIMPLQVQGRMGAQVEERIGEILESVLRAVAARGGISREEALGEIASSAFISENGFTLTDYQLHFNGRPLEDSNGAPFRVSSQAVPASITPAATAARAASLGSEKQQVRVLAKDAAPPIVDRILQRARELRGERPVYVVIDGDSGAGKTVFARRFFDDAGSVIVASLDRFAKHDIDLSDDENWGRSAGAMHAAIDNALKKQDRRLVVIEGFEVGKAVRVMQSSYGTPVDIVIHLQADEATRREDLVRREGESADIGRMLAENVQGPEAAMEYDFIIENSLSNRGNADPIAINWPTAASLGQEPSKLPDLGPGAWFRQGVRFLGNLLTSVTSRPAAPRPYTGPEPLLLTDEENELLDHIWAKMKPTLSEKEYDQIIPPLQALFKKNHPEESLLVEVGDEVTIDNTVEEYMYPYLARIPPKDPRYPAETDFAHFMDALRHSMDNAGVHGDNHAVVLIRIRLTPDKKNLSVMFVLLDRGKGFVDGQNRHVPIHRAVRWASSYGPGGNAGNGMPRAIEQSHQFEVTAVDRSSGKSAAYYWDKSLRRERALPSVPEGVTEGTKVVYVRDNIPFRAAAASLGVTEVPVLDEIQALANPQHDRISQSWTVIDRDTMERILGILVRRDLLPGPLAWSLETAVVKPRSLAYKVLYTDLNLKWPATFMMYDREAANIIARAVPSREIVSLANIFRSHEQVPLEPFKKNEHEQAAQYLAVYAVEAVAQEVGHHIYNLMQIAPTLFGENAFKNWRAYADSGEAREAVQRLHQIYAAKNVSTYVDDPDGTVRNELFAHYYAALVLGMPERRLGEVPARARELIGAALEPFGVRSEYTSGQGTFWPVQAASLGQERDFAAEEALTRQLFARFRNEEITALRPLDIEEEGLSRSRPWNVSTTKGEYVLMRHTARFTGEQIRWEYSLLSGLKRHRFGFAPKMLAARDGAFSVEHEGDLYVLYEFKQGDFKPWGSVTGDALRSAATVQGQLHKAARFAPEGEPIPQSQRFYPLNDITDVTAGREFLRKARDALPERFAGAQALLVSRLGDFEEQFDRIAQSAAARQPSALMPMVIHGDYNPKNVMFQGDEASAVIDFGYARPIQRREERALDLANGMINIDWHADRPDLSELANYLTFYKWAVQPKPNRAEILLLKEAYRGWFLEGINKIIYQMGADDPRLTDGYAQDVIRGTLANLAGLERADWNKLADDVLRRRRGVSGASLGTDEQIRKLITDKVAAGDVGVVWIGRNIREKMPEGAGAEIERAIPYIAEEVRGLIDNVRIAYVAGTTVLHFTDSRTHVTTYVNRTVPEIVFSEGLWNGLNDTPPTAEGDTENNALTTAAALTRALYLLKYPDAAPAEADRFMSRVMGEKAGQNRGYLNYVMLLAYLGRLAAAQRQEAELREEYALWTFPPVNVPGQLRGSLHQMELAVIRFLAVNIPSSRARLLALVKIINDRRKTAFERRFTPITQGGMARVIEELGGDESTHSAQITNLGILPFAPEHINQLLRIAQFHPSATLRTEAVQSLRTQFDGLTANQVKTEHEVLDEAETRLFLISQASTHDFLRDAANQTLDALRMKLTGRSLGEEEASIYARAEMAVEAKLEEVFRGKLAQIISSNRLAQQIVRSAGRVNRLMPAVESGYGLSRADLVKFAASPALMETHDRRMRNFFLVAAGNIVAAAAFLIAYIALSPTVLPLFPLGSYFIGFWKSLGVAVPVLGLLLQLLFTHLYLNENTEHEIQQRLIEYLAAKREALRNSPVPDVTPPSASAASLGAVETAVETVSFDAGVGVPVLPDFLQMPDEAEPFVAEPALPPAAATGASLGTEDGRTLDSINPRLLELARELTDLRSRMQPVKAKVNSGFIIGSSSRDPGHRQLIEAGLRESALLYEIIHLVHPFRGPILQPMQGGDRLFRKYADVIGITKSAQAADTMVQDRMASLGLFGSSMNRLDIVNADLTQAADRGRITDIAEARRVQTLIVKGGTQYLEVGGDFKTAEARRAEIMTEIIRRIASRDDLETVILFDEEQRYAAALEDLGFETVQLPREVEHAVFNTPPIITHYLEETNLGDEFLDHDTLYFFPHAFTIMTRRPAAVEGASLGTAIDTNVIFFDYGRVLSSQIEDYLDESIDALAAYSGLDAGKLGNNNDRFRAEIAGLLVPAADQRAGDLPSRNELQRDPALFSDWVGVVNRALQKYGATRAITEDEFQDAIYGPMKPNETIQAHLADLLWMKEQLNIRIGVISNYEAAGYERMLQFFRRYFPGLIDEELVILSGRVGSVKTEGPAIFRAALDAFQTFTGQEARNAIFVDNQIPKMSRNAGDAGIAHLIHYGIAGAEAPFRDGQLLDAGLYSAAGQTNVLANLISASRVSGASLGVLNMEAIEEALLAFQANFDAVNQDPALVTKREKIEENQIRNLIAAYAHLDYLMTQGRELSQDDFANLNIIARWGIAGQDYSIAEQMRPIQTARETFLGRLAGDMNFIPGNVSYVWPWYEKRLSYDTITAASYVYSRLLSQPQAFSEGNHRTGGLWMSAILVERGLPPFVIEVNGWNGTPVDIFKAVDYLNLSAEIKFSSKLRWSDAWRLWKNERAFRSFLRRTSPDRQRFLAQASSLGTEISPELRDAVRAQTGYEIVRLVTSKGARADVYEVRNAAGATFAMRLDRTDHPEINANHEEIRHRVPPHPHIAEFHESGRVQIPVPILGGVRPQTYQIYELVDGRDVSELLGGNFFAPLGPIRTADFIEQIFQALGHLYDHGVYMGEFNSEGIMITQKGQVKLVDIPEYWDRTQDLGYAAAGNVYMGMGSLQDLVVAIMTQAGGTTPYPGKMRMSAADAAKSAAMSLAKIYQPSGPQVEVNVEKDAGQKEWYDRWLYAMKAIAAGKDPIKGAPPPVSGASLGTEAPVRDLGPINLDRFELIAKTLHPAWSRDAEILGKKLRGTEPLNDADFQRYRRIDQAYTRIIERTDTEYSKHPDIAKAFPGSTTAAVTMEAMLSGVSLVENPAELRGSPSTFTAPVNDLIAAPGALDNLDALSAGVQSLKYNLTGGHYVSNYNGGLGVLMGDEFGAWSDIGVPSSVSPADETKNGNFLAFGLFYRKGVFLSTVNEKGSQVESYAFVNDQKIENPVTETLLYPEGHPKAGQPVVLRIPFKSKDPIYDGHVRVEVAYLGGVKTILFNPNIPENAANPYYQDAMSYVYKGSEGRDDRFIQEWTLGVGSIEFMKEMGLHPGALHLNEAATVFSIPALIKYYMDTEKVNYTQAKALVRKSVVFTTHTLEPEALASYDVGPAGHQVDLNAYLTSLFRDYSAADSIVRSFLHAGKRNLDSSRVYPSRWAIMLSERRNAVSTLNAHEATKNFTAEFTGTDKKREQWKEFVGEDLPDEIFFDSITNGVRRPFWQSRWLQEKIDSVPDGLEDILDYKNPHHRGMWEKLHPDQEIPAGRSTTLTDTDIWEHKKLMKQRMIAQVRLYIAEKIIANIREIEGKIAREAKQAEELGEDRAEQLTRLRGRLEAQKQKLANVPNLLSEDKMTLTWARRVAGYKRMLFTMMGEHLISSPVEELLAKKGDATDDDIDRVIDGLEANGAFNNFKDMIKNAQFLFAGKAHPQYGEGLVMIRLIHRIIDRYQWQNSVVYVPGYDERLSQALLQGSDIWLASSEIPREASGTSGMKAMMNGTLILHTLDGFVKDGVTHGVNGFIYGKPEKPAKDHAAKTAYYAEEHASLQQVFQEALSTFTGRTKVGGVDVPLGWVAMMRASIYYGSKVFGMEGVEYGRLVPPEGTQPGYFEFYAKSSRELSRELFIQRMRRTQPAIETAADGATAKVKFHVAVEARKNFDPRELEVYFWYGPKAHPDQWKPAKAAVRFTNGQVKSDVEVDIPIGADKDYAVTYFIAPRGTNVLTEKNKFMWRNREGQDIGFSLPQAASLGTGPAVYPEIPEIEAVKPELETLQAAVPGIAQDYSAEHNRPSAPVIVKIAKWLGNVLYLPDADRVLFQWYLGELSLEPEPVAAAGTAPAGFNEDPSLVINFLKSQVAGFNSSSSDSRLPLILTHSVLMRKGETAAQTAERFISQLHQGDGILAIWNRTAEKGRKPSVIASLYGYGSRAQIRVRDIAEELVTPQALARFSKDFNTTGISVTSSAELEIHSPAGDNIKLDLDALARAGIDPVQVVGLLRQLADAPDTVRARVYEAAGIQATAQGYWLVGEGFAAMVQKLYTEKAALESMARAA